MLETHNTMSNYTALDKQIQQIIFLSQRKNMKMNKGNIFQRAKRIRVTAREEKSARSEGIVCLNKSCVKSARE